MVQSHGFPIGKGESKSIIKRKEEEIWQKRIRRRTNEKCEGCGEKNVLVKCLMNLSRDTKKKKRQHKNGV